jgi:hypothetical protein
MRMPGVVVGLVFLLLSGIACKERNREPAPEGSEPAAEREQTQSALEQRDVSNLERPASLHNKTIMVGDANWGAYHEICSDGRAFNYERFAPDDDLNTSTGIVCGNIRRGVWGLTRERNFIFVPQVSCENGAADQDICAPVNCGALNRPLARDTSSVGLAEHWDTIQTSGESALSEGYVFLAREGAPLCE